MTGGREQMKLCEVVTRGYLRLSRVRTMGVQSYHSSNYSTNENVNAKYTQACLSRKSNQGVQ
jgi:hypothetical protein